MAPIILAHISKRFGAQAQLAVDDLSLAVRESELLVLLGPSGCGKTTTLRMIAGFERPQTGSIALGADVVASERAWVPPERRGIGIVFQDYALFPHLSVAQNIAFGMLRLGRAERKQRVATALDAVDLAPYADRYPHELSGGQQQRVAIARALAPQPRVLLLDEPFSNLDPELRTSLRYEVRAIVQRVGITTVLVTHDQSEAFAMADRIAVMHEGHVHQVDTPERLYRQPHSRFVAGFVGRAQWILGDVHGAHVETELGMFPNGSNSNAATVDVLLRPEELQLAPDARGRARVVGREFGGPTVRYTIRLASGQHLDVVQPSFDLLPLDTCVHVLVLPTAPVMFSAQHARFHNEQSVAVAAT
jgi:iron(III) transport system ATP-binding protein